jgi:hypothetical protein
MSEHPDTGPVDAVLTARLIGSYRLVGIESIDGEGHIVHPFGLDPAGVCTFTAEGYMTIVISRRDREAFGVDDILAGSMAERSDAFGAASAFAGRFHVIGGRVRFDLLATTYPNWVGTSQTRDVLFEEDQVILVTPMLLMDGAMRSSRVVLERERPGSPGRGPSRDHR